MAGDKIIMGATDCATFGVGGLPLAIITENVESGDEWGLFRLTDDGLSWYKEGPDFRASIMSMFISNKRAVEEIARRKTRTEAEEVRRMLPEDEAKRVLIRSVKPGRHWTASY